MLTTLTQTKMKKLLLIVSIFFISCTPTNIDGGKLTDSEIESLIGDCINRYANDSCYYSLAMDHNDYRFCLEMGSQKETDSCLVWYSNIAMLHYQNYPTPDPNICHPISDDNDRAACYNRTAVVLMDQKLCEYLDQVDIEYFSTEKCKNEISYKYGENYWENDAPLKTDGWKYKGKAQISGWLVNVSSYVGLPEIPHFRVIEEDRIKLPPIVKIRDLRIDERQYSVYINELLSSSEENPITIEIDEFNIPNEGTPSIYIIDIITP